MIFFLTFFIILLWFRPSLGGILLHYEIFYGPLKLGESKISISEKEYKAIAYTTGIGDIIYPYYAEWITSLDEKGYPLTAVIYSKDRFKERRKILYFDSKNQKVILEKILPKYKKKVFQIYFPVFDELSSFVYSWKLNYFSQKKYNLPLYIDGEKHFVSIDYIGILNCKYNDQEMTCFNLMVELPEKSELLKRSRKVQVYLLDKEKIPVEITGSLPLFGNLKAYLKEVKTF
ncbi:MAG: DUF3108 domain-containing protein [Caldimicrobium sp.]